MEGIETAYSMPAELTTAAIKITASVQATEPEPDPALTERVEEAWRAAEDFEAIYLRMMLRTMRKTSMETGLFGESSNAMQVYQSLQDDYLAEQLSRSRQFGLSRMIFDYLVGNTPELKKTLHAVQEASRAYQMTRETDGLEGLQLLEQTAKTAE